MELAQTHRAYIGGDDFNRGKAFLVDAFLVSIGIKVCVYV